MSEKKSETLLVELKIEITIANEMTLSDYLELKKQLNFGKTIDNMDLIDKLCLNKRPLTVVSFKEEPSELNENILNSEINIIA